MSSSAPVGFMDSGIGGITVLKRAVELLPNENYFFFSDSKNNPYGDKTDKEIIKRCTELVTYMVEEKQCKAIVIACNTASAKAVRSLRAQFTQLPIIAIEPAYKMVHDHNPQGNTLIMATKGTISSEKFRRLYYSYYNHHTSLLSCVGLADIIEDGTKQELSEYLEKLLSSYKGRVQNVVLGCTHYPLAKAEIKNVLGAVEFFDGAAGVGKRLEYILRENDILNTGSDRGVIKFEDSSVTEEKRDQKKNRFYTLLNEDF